MKVSLVEKIIQSYTMAVNVEVDGQTYRADIWYDEHDGYDVRFLDDNGRYTSNPQWATDYIENDVNGDSLGYWLEEQMEDK